MLSISKILPGKHITFKNKKLSGKSKTTKEMFAKPRNIKAIPGSKRQQNIYTNEE